MIIASLLLSFMPVGIMATQPMSMPPPQQQQSPQQHYAGNADLPYNFSLQSSYPSQQYHSGSQELYLPPAMLSAQEQAPRARALAGFLHLSSPPPFVPSRHCTTQECQHARVAVEQYWQKVLNLARLVEMINQKMQQQLGNPGMQQGQPQFIQLPPSAASFDPAKEPGKRHAWNLFWARFGDLLRDFYPKTNSVQDDLFWASFLQFGQYWPVDYPPPPVGQASSTSNFTSTTITPAFLAGWNAWIQKSRLLTEQWVQMSRTQYGVTEIGVCQSGCQSGKCAQQQRVVVYEPPHIQPQRQCIRQVHYRHYQPHRQPINVVPVPQIVNTPAIQRHRCQCTNPTCNKHFYIEPPHAQGAPSKLIEVGCESICEKGGCCGPAISESTTNTANYSSSSLKKRQHRHKHYRHKQPITTFDFVNKQCPVCSCGAAMNYKNYTPQQQIIGEGMQQPQLGITQAQPPYMYQQ